MKLRTTFRNLFTASLFLGLVACEEGSHLAPPEQGNVLEETFKAEGEPMTASFADHSGNGISAAVAGTSVATQQPTQSTRQLIWNANIAFEVDNIEKASASISRLCDQHQAQIARSNFRSTDYQLTYDMTIRVQQNEFNNLIAALKGQASKIEKVNITSRDVTEEFVDITTRLATKKEARKRYMDILRNKTGDVKDVIAAENAIRQITEEIEAKEGRLRYLKDQVQYSTITLQMHQQLDYKAPPVQKDAPLVAKLKRALMGSINLLTNILVLFIYIWPAWIILGWMWYKKKWFFKNR